MLNNQNAIRVKAIRAPCCSIRAYAPQAEQNGIQALCFASLALYTAAKQFFLSFFFFETCWMLCTRIAFCTEYMYIYIYIYIYIVMLFTTTLKERVLNNVEPQYEQYEIHIYIGICIYVCVCMYSSVLSNIHMP